MLKLRSLEILRSAISELRRKGRSKDEVSKLGLNNKLFFYAFDKVCIPYQDATFVPYRRKGSSPTLHLALLATGATGWLPVSMAWVISTSATTERIGVRLGGQTPPA